MQRHSSEDNGGHRATAFTIVELLVVVAIIAMLIAILLPAIGKVRDKAKVSLSESNLRNMGIAHASYASDANDRQFTLTPDNIAAPTGPADPPPPPLDAQSAVLQYIADHIVIMPDGTTRDTGEPPPVQLGWYTNPGSTGKHLALLRIAPAFPKNYVLLEPIAFEGAWGDPDIDIERFGYFRMPNARQFSSYLNGRFYDPVFYAPKDVVVNEMRDDAADSPNEFTPLAAMQAEYRWGENDFCYSSYSLSPAALYSPEVMAETWVNPWTVSAGFRAPSMSQARYATLKTHMLEHHWLQGNVPVPCNPNVLEDRLRPYKDCQPYYFNQSRESSPAALFYDGHVNSIGVGEAERDDGRARTQSDSDAGLWTRTTPWGTDGYFISRGYDDANTSFHVLTLDGIRGRDVLGQ